MSWEWFGDLKELNGDPGTITSQHTWDWLIDALNDGTWDVQADTGQYLSEGSGDYYFGGGDAVTKTTSYGLTLRMRDSRVTSGGGLDFETNVPVPGIAAYYGFSLAGLMYYGGFKIAVDHNAEEALIMLVRVFQNGPYYTTYDWLGQYSNHTARNVIYNFIMSNAPSAYNWTSVPSINGKNGTISLAQIASGSINDGEPVSDAAATAFSDLPAECNVGEIIDELLPYEESLVDVLVKYKVKGAVTGAFEYVKLVAKKGSIPKSIEDGDKVVDIDPSKKSKLVTGLDEGSKYYFVIFIKDSADQTAKSNEMWIVTGAIPIPSEYRPYVEKMNLTSWGSSDQLTLLAYSCLSGNSNTYTIDDIYSYYIQDGNFSGNANAYDFFILSDCSINISTGSSITVTYDINMAPTDLVTVSGRSMWGAYSYTGNYTGSQYGYIGSTFGDRTGVSILGATSEFTGNPTTSFNTLLDCMQYLAQHFRRVKSLFVDGTQWI